MEEEELSRLDADALLALLRGANCYVNELEEENKSLKKRLDEALIGVQLLADLNADLRGKLTNKS